MPLSGTGTKSLRQPHTETGKLAHHWSCGISLGIATKCSSACAFVDISPILLPLGFCMILHIIYESLYIEYSFIHSFSVSIRFSNASSL